MVRTVPLRRLLRPNLDHQGSQKVVCKEGYLISDVSLSRKRALLPLGLFGMLELKYRGGGRTRISFDNINHARKGLYL